MRTRPLVLGLLAAGTLALLGRLVAQAPVGPIIPGGGGGGAPTGPCGGDLGGTYPNCVVIGLNNTNLAGLTTGIVKNTTGTGVPSIALASDFPSLEDTRHTLTSVIEQVAIGGSATLNLATLGTGTVNTSGTSVTSITGSSFVGMASAVVKIATVSYTVASVADSTHMTLTTSAGTQTGSGILMPGTITKIQAAITDANNSSLLDSKLNIYCDGAASPGQSTDFGTYFQIHGGTGSTQWNNPQMGVNTYVNASNWGGYRNTQINYSTGCTVDVVNGSATAGTMWTQVYYKPGPPPLSLTGNTRNKWHCLWTGATVVTQFSAIDLLPSISTGPGEIESVYLLVLNNSGYGYQEGNVAWTVDGVSETSAGGTEDYFGGQYYFNNGTRTYRGVEWGGWMGLELPNISSNAFSSALYRWHYPYTRIPFSSTARLTWNNGQSGQGTPAGSVTILSLVTYWTAN